MTEWFGQRGIGWQVSLLWFRLGPDSPDIQIKVKCLDFDKLSFALFGFIINLSLFVLF